MRLRLLSFPPGLRLSAMLLSLALASAACERAAPPPNVAPRPARAPVVTVAASHVLSPADIAARALPSVVTIRTAGSLGTGFLVKSDGWIATNMHVVVGGPKVRVTLRDSRELDVVEVLAASPEYDLALLRVEAHGLPALALGDSDAMRPGDPVVAIGNPLGLEDTVSNGLVSARRKVDGGAEVLQISAPIAPGSSGGPIFNEKGEVIGIATAIVQGGQNINFGVPARYLAPMIKDPAPMPLADFAALIAQLRAAGTPKSTRKIPHYPASLLDGCSMDAQKLLVRMIGDAVDAGAPLYNAHNPEACYHIYDGTAADLLRKLAPSCRGPVKSLADAQKHAAQVGGASDKAWIMRDTFDALVEVVMRKHHGAGGAADHDDSLGGQ
ncbi:MAG TPA: trypsin-like peptidase domain-containing protein [Polyangiaceae bacterium]|jgi:serine protease Do|nr:trypsin-like peptidase domain-containing protein [Polyangiaceae bacterium]